MVEKKKDDAPFVQMTTKEIAALIIPGQPIPEDLRPRLSQGQLRYWRIQWAEREAKTKTLPVEK